MTTRTYTMHQGRTTAITRTLAQYDIRDVVFRAALSLIAAALVLYAYFIAATVADVIARTHAEANTVALKSEVSALETTYLARSAGITRTLATEQGFVEAQGTLFASVPSAGSAVAYVSHEVR
ncbi:MAG: hypothetical protein A2675_02710 [Candidatus Yonathbacteria bacterium RIFCSPHIGHO2_01_FULL_51_10]|uniref:Cell division protein FtsL n=1 Tax=Candidatus Yonathbacteria bacterium RIFCSPHIGHO2_01_FULL_51_10 TaxID=1802723 RepID=A0A1G2S6M1_9BACT|nr:MAG: hypothetical protein A2675_02710 [Candidatus Yonathbacteria bacterium RIFCSPHIGHO2_01_FULL_51_10]